MFDKVIDRIDDAAANFITVSPLVVLATGDDTRSDASPRGGEASFVKVIGPNQLAFGDLTGNNRLDSFANLVSNPMIEMLFVVPSLGETLRVRGAAALVRDVELTARCAIGERVPKTVVVVDVEECYLQCGAAFKRAGAHHEAGPTEGNRWPASREGHERVEIE